MSYTLLVKASQCTYISVSFEPFSMPSICTFIRSPIVIAFLHHLLAMAQNDYTGFERRASDSTADTEACNIEENEGGASAWLTVAGSFLVYYSSFGVINSFGFFQNYYQHDFLDSTAPPTIAIIGTLQLYLMNTIAPVSGALCDTFGFKVICIFLQSGTLCWWFYSIYTSPLVSAHLVHYWFSLLSTLPPSGTFSSLRES